MEFVDPVEDLETACNVGTGRYGIGIRREKVNLLVHVNAREGQAIYIPLDSCRATHSLSKVGHVGIP